jgi:hypothetical protein
MYLAKVYLNFQLQLYVFVLGNVLVTYNLMLIALAYVSSTQQT